MCIRDSYHTLDYFCYLMEYSCLKTIANKHKTSIRKIIRQHKEELDTFNKAVRTLMKLNGSTAVDFSALDAEFSEMCIRDSYERLSRDDDLAGESNSITNQKKYQIGRAHV